MTAQMRRAHLLGRRGQHGEMSGWTPAREHTWPLRGRRWGAAVVAMLLVAMLPATADRAAATAPNTWSVTGAMAVARAGQTATLLPDGTVLVAGGGTASAELYDPS